MKITFPPVILLASIVLQIILLFSFPISVDLSSLLGLILILSGISLVFVSFRFMRKMKTTFIPDGTPEVLISSGPFKFSRNPIYLGMLTVLVGVAFLMSSLSAIIIAFVFGIIINFTWIAHEKKNFTNCFQKIGKITLLKLEGGFKALSYRKLLKIQPFL